MAGLPLMPRIMTAGGDLPSYELCDGGMCVHFDQIGKNQLRLDDHNM
jgi:hypothetical protein